MSPLILLAFLLLVASFLSVWVRRAPAIWGTLLGLSLLCGWMAGHIGLIGLLFISVLAYLWSLYHQRPTLLLFLLLIALSAPLPLGLLPGCTPFFFTSKLSLGLDAPLLGLFPLALLVPLARHRRDWVEVGRGLLWGCSGIAVLAVLATLSGATHWQLKLPSVLAIRLLSNLVLTCVPQESFYRGFMQATLCTYLGNGRLGKAGALLLTSLLFTAAHLAWSPNLSILIFVFLASLLYGGVYLISGKIESSILCHFLLNVIHMTFFAYHAM